MAFVLLSLGSVLQRPDWPIFCYSWVELPKGLSGWHSVIPELCSSKIRVDYGLLFPGSVSHKPDWPETCYSLVLFHKGQGS